MRLRLCFRTPNLQSASIHGLCLGHGPASSRLRSQKGVVTLSQTERNLPTTANVDESNFKDLACWLIVQIGPISLNVTTPDQAQLREEKSHVDAVKFRQQRKIRTRYIHKLDIMRCIRELNELTFEKADVSLGQASSTKDIFPLIRYDLIFPSSTVASMFFT